MYHPLRKVELCIVSAEYTQILLKHPITLHGYTVHQIMLNTFYYQLTYTTLKNVELLKHSKINKNAPTCFGLHENHLQGAKVSTWLKVTRLV